MPDHNGSTTKSLTSPNDPRRLSSISSETSEAIIDDWSPATKDLLDALPQARIRGLLYLLIALTVTVLPWSMLSKVDETGKARGQLEPKDKTIQLDAPVTGKVAELKVEEGDFVKGGQVLLVLESDVTRAELEQLQTKKSGDQNRLSQLNSLKNQLIVSLRVQQLQNQTQQKEKSSQLEQARQEIDISKAAYRLAEIQLVGSQNKVPRYRQVFEAGAITQDRFEEAKQEAEEDRSKLIKAQAELAQAKHQLQEHQRNYLSLIHSGKLAVLKIEEQLKNLESEISKLKSEISQDTSRIKSIEFQLQRRVVKAPHNGTVFHLAVQSAGIVVQPGQKLVEIAPEEASLILRAHMATSESESLRVGMPVKTKFDAYPFQDYGVVDGQVNWVSPDSKTQETKQGEVETFELEIELNQTYIESAHKRFTLTPGQTATAEVIIRQRRVIDFILDPFKKLRKGGLDL